MKTKTVDFGSIKTVGHMVGVFTGAFMAEGAGNAAMGVGAVVGAIVGVVSSRLLVHFAGKLLKADITPIILGIVLCLTISVPLGQFVEWYTALSVGMVLTGAFIGITYISSVWHNRRTKP